MESQGETVLVVMNANRGGKGSMEDLNWALKSIVRPRDTVIVLGVIFESCSKLKSSCFPFLMHIGISGLCDDLAMDFGWKARWCVALEIGGSLRYLHEECVDGPIVHLSVCSDHVVFSNGYSIMLVNFRTAKWLTDDVSSQEVSPSKCKNFEEDEYLSVDIHDYGNFLLELITGKNTSFQAQGNGQKLVDGAIPLLQNGSTSELMDTRLTDTSDTKLVQHMANAALCCLKKCLESETFYE